MIVNLFELACSVESKCNLASESCSKSQCISASIRSALRNVQISKIFIFHFIVWNRWDSLAHKYFHSGDVLKRNSHWMTSVPFCIQNQQLGEEFISEGITQGGGLIAGAAAGTGSMGTSLVRKVNSMSCDFCLADAMD
ncbi:unnamed protein product [Pseudo-nitzschia multistriata]|uniref:Uncharacterized protein n=1 Tax=Pseudo-nitzschia multistriata TaxID=183589 RepID=A0A448ZEV2_9STRA|nr:unnamed protein product [Pseudo-nitzschia multistriata]